MDKLHFFYIDFSTMKVKNMYFKIKFATENIELGESKLKNDYTILRYP